MILLQPSTAEPIGLANKHHGTRAGDLSTKGFYFDDVDISARLLGLSCKIAIPTFSRITGSEYPLPPSVENGKFLDLHAAQRCMPKQSLCPSPFGLNALGTRNKLLPVSVTLTMILSYPEHPFRSLPSTINLVVVSMMASGWRSGDRSVRRQGSMYIGAPRSH